MKKKLLKTNQPNELFDYDSFEKDAIEKLGRGEVLGGKNGVLTPLIKRLLESALEGEIEAFMEQQPSGNRRNGKLSKQLKTSHGNIDLSTPRDRNSTFQPKIVKKRETTLGEGLDEKIISMYSMGMSYADIRNHLLELYGLEVSSAWISGITDKVFDEIRVWQQRPLEAIYAFVWLDAIHFKVREDGRTVSKAAYTMLGLRMDGTKELLGLYLSDNEGARLWMQVLTDIQNRGVQDMLIACIDNLNGFAEAIESIFPQTEVQLCIVHQIRNSLKYIPWKDQRAFMSDLKPVYRATSKQAAESNLKQLETKWGSKYPVVIEQWRRNWERLSRYFKYPEDIRRIMYTTNTVEGFHRQLRKVTKTKGAFSNDNALIKLLYLAQNRITSKWRRPPKTGGGLAKKANYGRYPSLAL